MNEVDDEGLNRQAIAAIAAAVQRRKWEFSSELEKPAWMGVAWLIRAVRTAEAAAILYERGFSSEAAPLVRSVIQHTAALAWLVEKKHEAVDAIVYFHRQHQRRLLDSAFKAEWDLEIDEDLESFLAELDEKKPPELVTLANFQEMCRQAGLGVWYASFRVESALSHPTYLSGSIYWRENGSGEGGGFHYDDPFEGASLRVTAVMLLLAAAKVDELSPDAAFSAKLMGIQEELGIAVLEPDSEP